MRKLVGRLFRVVDYEVEACPFVGKKSCPHLEFLEFAIYVRLANSSKLIKPEWLRSKTRALLISNGSTHEMPDPITKIESFVGENLKRFAFWFFSELRSRSIFNLRGSFNHKNEWSLSDCCFG